MCHFLAYYLVVSIINFNMKGYYSLLRKDSIAFDEVKQVEAKEEGLV